MAQPAAIGPSMAQHGSPGIHAGRPTTRNLHSASRRGGRSRSKTRSQADQKLAYALVAAAEARGCDGLRSDPKAAVLRPASQPRTSSAATDFKTDSVESSGCASRFHRQAAGCQRECSPEWPGSAAPEHPRLHRGSCACRQSPPDQCVINVDIVGALFIDRGFPRGLSPCGWIVMAHKQSR